MLLINYRIFELSIHYRILTQKTYVNKIIIMIYVQPVSAELRKDEIR